MPLSPADRAILALATTPFVHAGEKENAIRELGLSPTRFWQRVNALLSDPSALEADPVRVRLLTAQRDRALSQRTRQRVA